MSKSQKIDPTTGEQFVPGHSRAVERIEKTVTGIAAGVRVLTDRLTEQAKANDTAKYVDTVKARQRELKPWTDAAKAALVEMEKVREECSPAVLAVLTLDITAVQRLLPIKQWSALHAVYNEAKALEHVIAATSETLRAVLREVANFSPAEVAEHAWRGTFARITEVVDGQAKHPADIRRRVELLKLALEELEAKIQKAAKPAPVVEDEDVPQQQPKDVGDFRPNDTDPTSAEDRHGA